LKKIKPLEINECPVANLPEKKAGRWGAGLTALKMTERRWLKPRLVGQFEFVEWRATITYGTASSLRCGRTNGRRM
jgi:hypothetical protein